MNNNVAYQSGSMVVPCSYTVPLKPDSNMLLIINFFVFFIFRGFSNWKIVLIAQKQI